MLRLGFDIFAGVKEEEKKKKKKKHYQKMVRFDSILAEKPSFPALNGSLLAAQLDRFS